MFDRVGPEAMYIRAQAFIREHLTDAARVLAIYPGTPHVVVTDAPPITGTPSAWANPFPATPDEVVLFDPR